MQEGQPGFPLPAEAWLDELLASIFRMLINLESTDANGKDHVTFLMNDSSLYRLAVGLLSADLHSLLPISVFVLQSILASSRCKFIRKGLGCNLPTGFRLDFTSPGTTQSCAEASAN